MKRQGDKRGEREPRTQKRSLFQCEERWRSHPKSSKEGESSFYKGSVGSIWQGTMKWLPAVSEEEGVEGMTARGGGKLSVGADKEGGASV